MPVDIFGNSSQKVVCEGITLAQAINAFLRRDGGNAATADINLNSHKITNVLNPTSAQDATTKSYVDGLTFLPHEKVFSSVCNRCEYLCMEGVPRNATRTYRKRV